MKRILTALSAVLFIMHSPFAQKTLEKGKVIMEITDVSSNDEQVAMAMEMMKGGKTEINFNNDMNSSKSEMMGGMMEIYTLTNNKTGVSDMLMNMMGQKMWISSTIEDMKKENSKTLSTLTVSPDLNDKKVVLGYNCYAVNVNSSDNPDMKLKCYVTKDVKTSANIIQGYQGLNLEGFPMEFMVTNAMMSITVKAKEVSDKTDDSTFVLKTDGYKKMTSEEFKKMMGGMGF